MRTVLLISLMLFSKFQAQNKINCDTIGLHSQSENVYSKFAFGDSLSSSFCLSIKKEVKKHKHATHSEHVWVIDGEGMMTVGNQTFTIRKGDLVFIPKNTVHSVRRISTKDVLRVISIQSPMFDGSDRIMIE
jgi:mannose-6-phosphate isomerase-like protein (cupin superfamily)